MQRRRRDSDSSERGVFGTAVKANRANLPSSAPEPVKNSLFIFFFAGLHHSALSANPIAYTGNAHSMLRISLKSIYGSRPYCNTISRHVRLCRGIVSETTPRSRGNTCSDYYFSPFDGGKAPSILRYWSAENYFAFNYSEFFLFFFFSAEFEFQIIRTYEYIPR